MIKKTVTQERIKKRMTDTFQRQANVTQDLIMKYTVEQRNDKNETERNNIFSARSYKGGILVLAH